jgi:IS30 family transposase
VLKAKNYKQKEIAEAIEKDKSVVSRELRRNSDKRNGVYKADLAQRKYAIRQAEKPKHICFTSEMKSYVIAGLENDYSPEQIHGRAKLDGVACVSHERIYGFIWEDKKAVNSLELYMHLRHKGRKYAKRGNTNNKRGTIKNRVDIDQRPTIVDKKTRFGDLEIDTVIGKNHQGALLTINDRVTSLVWIQRLDSKHEEPLTKATL